MNQRWRDRLDSYRAPDEQINPAAFEVSTITSDSTARAFVEQHHYSASYPAAQYRFGLHHGEQLVGVAVFSVPVNDKALAVLPGSPRESTELGRFVLLDQVPGNGETWFLARCFEQLRAEGLVGVLSFSDPTARVSADGRQVFGGHIGTIYQAHNARYFGRATARTLRLLPDGRVFSARAAQKIRKQERGWRYAVADLEAHGAEAFAGSPVEWLARAVAKVTRTVRHPGNHKYAWALNRRDWRKMGDGLPYPKAAA